MAGNHAGAALFQAGHQLFLQACSIGDKAKDSVGVVHGLEEQLLGDVLPVEGEQHLPVQPGNLPLYPVVFGEHGLQRHLGGELACLIAQDNGVQSGLHLPVHGGGCLPGALADQLLGQPVDVGMGGAV